jgi:hypothetical protein
MKNNKVKNDNLNCGCNKQKICEHKNQTVTNYNPMWKDGDVICKDCGKFIRTWDAG